MSEIESAALGGGRSGAESLTCAVALAWTVTPPGAVPLIEAAFVKAAVTLETTHEYVCDAPTAIRPSTRAQDGAFGSLTVTSVSPTPVVLSTVSLNVAVAPLATVCCAGDSSSVGALVPAGGRTDAVVVVVVPC